MMVDLTILVIPVLEKKILNTRNKNHKKITLEPERVHVGVDQNLNEGK